MNQATADKIIDSLRNIIWFGIDITDGQKFIEAKRVINSLVSEPETDNEIAKRKVKEFMQVIVDRKYAMSTKEQKLRVLWDCVGWFEKKPYDPHEVAQTKDQ